MDSNQATQIATIIRTLARQIAIDVVKENEAQKILPNIKWPNENLNELIDQQVDALIRFLEKI